MIQSTISSLPFSVINFALRDMYVMMVFKILVLCVCCSVHSKAGPIEIYNARVQKGLVKRDAVQEKALVMLDSLHRQLINYDRDRLETVKAKAFYSIDISSFLILNSIISYFL